MTTAISTSEEHGLELLSDNDLLVYSVGISTGGVAEMRMAALNPQRHIIASTVDAEGADFAKEQIARERLENQVEVKFEDVSLDLPYDSGIFDFVYARLVLHYLPKDKLEKALSELYRILKLNGRVFIVVRSDKCDHAHMPDSVYDPVTQLTEYSDEVLLSTDPRQGPARVRRHFFSEEELSNYVERAGWKIGSVTRHDELLFKDFKRTVADVHPDNLVELIATKN